MHHTIDSKEPADYTITTKPELDQLMQALRILFATEFAAPRVQFSHSKTSEMLQDQERLVTAKLHGRIEGEIIATFRANQKFSAEELRMIVKEAKEETTIPSYRSFDTLADKAFESVIGQQTAR